MTHLVIQLKKVSEGGTREVVSSDVIERLYNAARSAGLISQTTDVKGDLLVDKTYKMYVDFLALLNDSSNPSGKYRDLDILVTSLYIYFDDAAVESYWANSVYGDGTGITMASAATITLITNNPFLNNTNITSLNGMLYFINCTTINGKFAENATNLVSFIAPASLTLLSVPPSSAFSGYHGTFIGCSSLANVTLNEGLLKIGTRAFYLCTSLQTIDIPSTVTVLSSDGTDGGYGAFQYCSGLTNVTGGEGITILGTSTFSLCTSLLHINDIQFSNITSIELGCFDNCENLEFGALSIPNITSIKNGVFNNCKKLTSINIPNVTTINPDDTNSGSFYDCSALTTVTGSNIQNVGYMSFRYCTSLSTIDLSNVTYIGVCAFLFCESLTSVVLNNAVQIENSAFSQCISLSGPINLSSCTSLGESAFEGCTNLSSIDFSNVTTFGGGCFKDCTSLGVGLDLDIDLDGKSFAPNVFRNTGYRSITLHETTKHTISGFAGFGLEDAFGYSMPNLVKFDLSDTKLTGIGALSSSNLVTLILPETYTSNLSQGRIWATSLLYVVCLNTNPVSSMKPDSYWGFVLMQNNFAIYVPDSAYNDYVDVFITNSNDPISSNRLKRISELPSTVTWYTKEHPSA